MEKAFRTLGWKQARRQLVDVMQNADLVPKGEEDKMEKEDFAVGYDDFAKLVRTKERLQTPSTEAERAFRALESRNRINLDTLLAAADEEGFPKSVRATVAELVQKATGGEAQELTMDQWLLATGCGGSLMSPRWQRVRNKAALFTAHKRCPTSEGVSEPVA
eukprot:TRINITY_DN9471_c0_g1_i1.p2 TRINITY_DN9471_c0_g1~~TRINITY_DN9471_c0_g1_i1.p2  ORF type:complete len:162 (+),score=78.12 TRINITY_DN9471_c0_g1_i1:3-488(+)